MPHFAACCAILLAVVVAEVHQGVDSRGDNDDFEYADENYLEDLDRRLQRCLNGLPALGPQGLPVERDPPHAPWLSAAKVRPYGTARRPGDICREEALDLVWEDGSALEAFAAAATCLQNHYKHAVGAVASPGLATAVKEALECVAVELKPRMPFL